VSVVGVSRFRVKCCWLTCCPDRQGPAPIAQDSKGPLQPAPGMLSCGCCARAFHACVSSCRTSFVMRVMASWRVVICIAAAATQHGTAHGRAHHTSPAQEPCCQLLTHLLLTWWTASNSLKQSARERWPAQQPTDTGTAPASTTVTDRLAGWSPGSRDTSSHTCRGQALDLSR
jgi:hypothetical protein